MTVESSVVPSSVRLSLRSSKWPPGRRESVDRGGEGDGVIRSRCRGCARWRRGGRRCACAGGRGEGERRWC